MAVDVKSLTETFSQWVNWTQKKPAEHLLAFELELNWEEKLTLRLFLHPLRLQQRQQVPVREVLL